MLRRHLNTLTIGALVTLAMTLSGCGGGGSAAGTAAGSGVGVGNSSNASITGVATPSTVAVVTATNVQ